MELFWIILCYVVILALCFWLGEHLQSRRTTRNRQPPAPPRAEPLPTPRQSAQTATRDLERLVRQLAAQLGLDEQQTEELFSTRNTCCPPPAPRQVIDLQEAPPEE